MPTISCTEFNRQLDEAIERRESVDTVGLREHAAACAECRCLWLDALVVDRAVAQWKKPVADAGLTDRILAQLADQAAASTVTATDSVAANAPSGAQTVPAKPHDDDVASRPRRRVNRTAGAAITVLALCLCAMLFVSRPRPQVPVTQPELVQNSQPGGAVNTRAIQANPGLTAQQTSPVATALASPGLANNGAQVELMVADAGSAYLHLAGDAAKAVTAASVLVPSADSADNPPPAPKDQEPWVDGMRREIAPVTHQLSHAFEFLIQAVPDKRAPAT
jgi:hypothetical protein